MSSSATAAAMPPFTASDDSGNSACRGVGSDVAMLEGTMPEGVVTEHVVQAIFRIGVRILVEKLQMGVPSDVATNVVVKFFHA